MCYLMEFRRVVTFNPHICTYYIGNEKFDREARKCDMVDRMRFQRRIKNSEPILRPVLVKKLEEISTRSETIKSQSVQDGQLNSINFDNR